MDPNGRPTCEAHKCLVDSKIDLSAVLKALLDPNVKKIAIANPLHAPYSQAAASATQKEGIYEKATDKFVLGENISQTASFIMSGAADIDAASYRSQTPRAAPAFTESPRPVASLPSPRSVCLA